MIQRRRSPRFDSNSSGEIGKRSEHDTVQEESLTESKKQHSRSSLANNMVAEMIQRRRSPRFESDSGGVIEKRLFLGGVQEGKWAETKKKHLKSTGIHKEDAEMTQRRRSPRFASSSSGEMGRSSEFDSMQKESWDESKNQHLGSVLAINEVAEMIQRRRSPRFDCNADGEHGKRLDGTLKSNRVETKKTPSRSIATQKQFAEVSQRRRSLRNCSSSRVAVEKRWDDGTNKENSSKNQPVKPIKAQKESVEVSQRRRSVRLASVSAGVIKRRSDFDGNQKGGGIQEPMRIIEVADDKKLSKRAGGIVDKQKRRVSPVVLTPIEGAERKRRKVEVSKKEGICIRGREKMGCCGLPGWTEEQEEALQTAYFRMKPSPHFWKKVSKMVPGKSAQECFNRVHADLATPTQPGPRSRSSRIKLSPGADFIASFSKPLQPIQPTTKGRKSSKRKSLAVQKMVRHLLRKHHTIDQRHEADLFSVLETSPSGLLQDSADFDTPATPGCASNPYFLQKCSESLSSARRKTSSRFKPQNQADYASPEVLKRVKNIALHEKYIDQLNFRETKRRTCAKNASSMTSRDSKEDALVKKGGVHAARTALLSEAKDVIGQYQHVQANTMGTCQYLDSDDTDAAYAEDDGGDG